MHRLLRVIPPLFLFLVIVLGAQISSAVSTTIVINEFDFDQDGTDAAEFVELKNVSGISQSLNGYTVQLVNGNAGGAAVYTTITLPNLSLAAGDYYVICGNAANVANCDLDVTPDTNLIQNGDPDGIGLRLSGTLIDAVSYGGNTGAPYTEGTGITVDDDPTQASKGHSRCADGNDTDVNSADFLFVGTTPGMTNNCPIIGDPNALKINEIDYDQPGVDNAEFIELKNTGSSPLNLSGFSIEFINGDGGGAVSYATALSLPDYTLAAGDYYVICGTLAAVTNCDNESAADSGFLQNGNPDAIGLRFGGILRDTVSYGGDTAAPYTEGTGTSAVDNSDPNMGLSRCPDGTDTNNNNNDFLFRATTPGAENTCGPDAQVVEIWQLQGAAHISPYNGVLVETNDNIVTAVRSNGFYIQTPDARADADIATSNAVLVFTSSAPTVVVGQQVDVRGTVTEFRPGGLADGGLTITEITAPIIHIDSSDNSLPAVTVVGVGGRVPPSAVINDEGPGSINVETGGSFDAATDGIDFYESLEAMLLQVNNAVVVASTNDFGETWVVSDGGLNATTLTPRGSILISPGDFNPERIQLEDTIYPGTYPTLTTGDSLTSPAIGVLDYGFGNYELLVTQAFTTMAGGLQREVTSLSGSDDELTVATFNVENLAGNAAPAEFASRADQIVNNLGSPDILVLEEIQDNNGTTNNGVTDATDTLNNLVNAIVTAGGPTYQFQQIDPVNGQDGGAGGGNIRVGFLYNPARVTFVSRPGGTSTNANSAVCGVNGAEVLYSPGRIDPTNSAFNTSRKPLVGEFVFNGETVFVIGLHFNSKGGDNPLFGFTQPPVFSSEVQRLQQATIVNSFVDSLLACQADANIIVLGDVNDFDFSAVAATLAGDDLTGLMQTLPPNERYSYVFEGNAQVLDQVLVSGNVFENLVAYDVVHVNAEFSDQVSDHDPSVMLVGFNGAPQVVDDEYSTDENAPLNVPAEEGVLANDSDPNDDDLTAVLVDTTTNGDLTLNPDGSFSYTPDVNFSGVDSFTYQASDGTELSSVATVTININDINQSPVVVNPGTQTNAAATVVSLQIMANDPDGDTLTYAATGLPDSLSIDSVSGLISGTLDNDAYVDSPYTVEVTATDDADPALSGSATFTWNVTTPAQPAVVTFTLVNADTDTDIGPIEDGDVIDLSLLPTANLSIRANTLGVLGSVRFGFDSDSNYRTDNNAPYTLGNGNGNNYQPVEMTVGTHTLTATPYTGNNGNGTAGTPLTITFEVQPQVVSGFVLVNADTDTDIGPLVDGALIDLSTLPTSNLSVRAVTSPATVGSVRFGLDSDSNYRTDNNAPYSLGNGNGGNYQPVELSAGMHTLTATTYTRSNANGIAGEPLTITFEVRAQVVSGFILVNADTDTDIMALTDGAVLDLAALPPNLNIRATTSPATVGSVRFGLDSDSNYRTDNNAPYSVGNGNGGNFNPLTLTLGTHTLTATAYTHSNANGVAGVPLVITFTVQNNVVFSPAEGATVHNPVTLTWNAITGATCYAVQVDNSRGFGSPEVNVIVVGTNSLTLSNLPPRTYYWRVGISADCVNAPTTWGERRSFVIAP